MSLSISIAVRFFCLWAKISPMGNASSADRDPTLVELERLGQLDDDAAALVLQDSVPTDLAARISGVLYRKFILGTGRNRTVLALVRDECAFPRELAELSTNYAGLFSGTDEWCARANYSSVAGCCACMQAGLFVTPEFLSAAVAGGCWKARSSANDLRWAALQLFQSLALNMYPEAVSEDLESGLCGDLSEHVLAQNERALLLYSAQQRRRRTAEPLAVACILACNSPRLLAAYESIFGATVSWQELREAAAAGVLVDRDLLARGLSSRPDLPPMSLSCRADLPRVEHLIAPVCRALRRRDSQLAALLLPYVVWDRVDWSGSLGLSSNRVTCKRCRSHQETFAPHPARGERQPARASVCAACLLEFVQLTTAPAKLVHFT